uniref:DM1 locus, WD repeat containing n=1 Tax=Ictidomys tridecemlineatus TaxID=43179 RepID=A0A287CU37_ICTTR
MIYEVSPAGFQGSRHSAGDQARIKWATHKSWQSGGVGGVLKTWAAQEVQLWNGTVIFGSMLLGPFQPPFLLPIPSPASRFPPTSASLPSSQWYKPITSIDLNKPIDKRIYKGTQPTCHDFNQFTAATETISLLVGFSAGQVQYLDLIKKDTSKLFNEERLIDKTKVTYLKWLPESESLFLASHASGHLYLYNVSHPCASAPPQYSLLKQGEGFAVYAAKSKAPRNPLAKWAVGEGPLNEFAFSPDGRHLACVSQDGCLRVFHFDSMLLRGLMKSYFGGLLCVCWSPDGRYVVTGGEDDLVTVWSFTEGRVVARGHGHKSWVNAVAFDPYTTRAEETTAASAEGDRSGEEEEEPEATRTSSSGGVPLSPLPKAGSITYRFGSAGQDTQFCLWDLTEDVLSPHPPLARTRTLPGTPGATPPATGSSRGSESGPGPLPRSLSRSNSLPHPAGGGKASSPGTVAEPGTPFSIGRFATLTLQERRDRGSEKEHKRYHSLGNISRGGGGGSGGGDKPSGPAPRSRLDPAKVLGTALCPRIHEVPLLEPLVCKKIAQERLTVLLFLEDCIITACQEGLICTWARPGKAFTDEETEAQAGEGSWPRSPSKSVVEVGLSLSSSSSSISGVHVRSTPLHSAPVPSSAQDYRGLELFYRSADCCDREVS